MVTDVLKTLAEVILESSEELLLSVECYKSSLYRLIGQISHNVISCKTKVWWVGPDWFKFQSICNIRKFCFGPLQSKCREEVICMVQVIVNTLSFSISQTLQLLR